MPYEPRPRFRTAWQRPAWWPENEPWPPHGAHWSESRRQQLRRLVRRLGCLFSVLVFTGLMIFSLLVILAANTVGIIRISGSLGWIIPLGGIILLAGIGLVAWAGYGLRRLSQPLGELIDAAERIAEGDYSRRVAERGPQEIRSVLSTFNHMAERLEAVTAQRRDFMADITHELRTPLTVIQGNLEGMLDGVYPADDNHLKATLEETQLMGRLVDDLRTLALAESGALQLLREPTDLAMLVADAAAVFNPLAQAQGVTLRVETTQDAGLFEVDGERLRQVLANLIANALRYTLAGGRIEVRFMVQQDATREWAQIEVQDTGQGIPVQDQVRVFERFYRGSDSKGMGLGLSIAKTLVEAHGGIINITSEPGQGTVFTIRLPA